MSDLISVIQAKFKECRTEVGVCRLYAEIRMETEKQMECMLEWIEKERKNEGK